MKTIILLAYIVPLCICVFLWLRQKTIKSTHVEIEYKFLINPLYRNQLDDILSKTIPTKIQQGYLNTSPERTVRARLAGDKGFITIKGIAKGIARPEYEYEIPASDATEMINNLCESTIFKERYKINASNGLFWEIDVFSGDNKGLIVAEIEVPSESTEITKPIWIGENVSENCQYTNSYLSKKPYTTWK